MIITSWQIAELQDGIAELDAELEKARDLGLGDWVLSLEQGRENAVELLRSWYRHNGLTDCPY